MTAKREITRSDILAMEDFAAIRQSRRAEISAIKRHRRAAIGPDATIYFESYDTMWWQIHEMLYIEKGGEAQIADELAAFNPLIPKGRELVATLMFEIDDPARRAHLLNKLGGVENCVTITVAGHCDERGTREYNLALGERRANATKNYLVSLGIEPGRISTISYGKERPIVLGHNKAAWGQNRAGISHIDG